jgi:hypothetical protein
MNHGGTGRFSSPFLIGICKRSQWNSNDVLLDETLHCLDLEKVCVYKSALTPAATASARSLSPMVGSIYKVKPPKRQLYSGGQCGVTESALDAAYSSWPHQEQKRGLLS